MFQCAGGQEVGEGMFSSFQGHGYKTSVKAYLMSIAGYNGVLISGTELVLACSRTSEDRTTHVLVATAVLQSKIVSLLLRFGLMFVCAYQLEYLLNLTSVTSRVWKHSLYTTFTLGTVIIYNL